jgi:hypothetical protein
MGTVESRLQEAVRFSCCCRGLAINGGEGGTADCGNLFLIYILCDNSLIELGTQKDRTRGDLIYTSVQLASIIFLTCFRSAHLNIFNPR